MSGTKEGGLKAADRNKKLYGEDYYARIGRIGGRIGTTGGFWWGKYVAKNNYHVEAGRRGGAISRKDGSRVIS